VSLLERLKGGSSAPVVADKKAQAPAAPSRSTSAPAVPSAAQSEQSVAAPRAAPQAPSTRTASSSVQRARRGPMAPKPQADKSDDAKASVGGVTGRLLNRQKDQTAARKGSTKKGPEDPYLDIKVEVQSRLVEQLDQDSLKAVENDDDRRAIVRGAIEKIVISVATEWGKNFTRQVQKRIVEELLDDVLGLGPLETLLVDSDVTEIMVNGPHRVYVVKNGKMVLSQQQFRNNDHVLHVIDRIVAPLGRRVDESSPMVDARLKDGSRVNAIIPPLALCGPTLTIRKFAEDPFTMKDLIAFGSMTNDMADFLAASVRIRLNIFVSGGAGSGKTTTLNVLSGFIPNDERIITIEDAAELQLAQEHVVSLETRPPNIEGTGEVTMRDLVKNCLRMRPERIIVGEVRSSEALDMLQAMNTGHDGSLATGHSNSPKDMISRLETMVMMAGFDVPPKAIRENIASAVDLVVQQNRMRDGTRKIMAVTEVQGIEGEDVILADIFKFEQSGVSPEGEILGDYRPTGIKQKFYNKFFQEGIILPESIFDPKS